MFGSPLLTKLIDLALEEDLAWGDVTSELCVSEKQKASARLIAREDLLVCGLPIIQQIVSRAKSSVQVNLKKSEGTWAKEGEVLAELRGLAREILALERSILNFLQRMSGVASAAAQAQKLAGKILVLDTRKTTPGWRVLEKYAVRCGGAHSHRFSLGDMILVKNNHIDACKGNLRALLTTLFQKKPAYMPVEVEVRNLKELKQALQFPVDVVMLDNFSNDEIATCMPLIRSKAPSPTVEASGGITAERLQKLSRLGIDTVSMGALTTQATNKDISLRIKI
jgi:nicotinate-nucleotide pyrophosphorylase (carboxylating)